MARVVLQMLGVLALSVGIANSFMSYSEETGEISERIIGGRPAADGQFPYAVALYMNGRFICTSSLISPTTVLTAAHCVVSQNGDTQAADSFYGMAGAADRRNGKRIDFASVTPHPEYNSRQLTNDIAYFRTTGPVELDANTRTICIAKADTGLNQYNNATALGWGSTSRVPTGSPNNLQYVEQRLLPHILCRLRYQGMVTDKHLCADGFGTGICYGDSGGPLAHQSANQSDIELGVASFVRIFPGCGSLATSPGVYTRVAAYTDWILQTTGDSEICTA